MNDEMNVLNDSAVTWLKMHKEISLGDMCATPCFNDLISDFRVVSQGEFLNLFNLKFKNLEVVNGLFSDLADPYWPLKVADNVIENKTLTLTSFFSSEPVAAQFSINVTDFNFIYFANSNESFYLVQHCANVSLVFPTLFKIVSLSAVSHWVNESLNKLPVLFEYLLDNFDHYSSVMLGQGAGNFLGYNVTQSRPYHYFYDYVYGLENLLKETESKSEVIKVFSVEGFDFLNLSAVNERIDYKSSDESSLNKYLIDQTGFLLMPCIQYCKSEFDRKLLRLSTNLISLANRNCESVFSFETDSEGLKIWVGVSNEKRSWLEQLDGFSNIISELSNQYSNIVVFVDGRTFPLTSSRADIANKKREDLLFNALVERNPSIKFINMIGMQAVEKIYLAQYIDFFISSYSTDSIYPSAICKKPGVVYVAPSIGNQKHLHIHHKIIEVPCDKVKEVVPSNGVKNKWYATSISMDWRDVYACVLHLIVKYEIRENVGSETLRQGSKKLEAQFNHDLQIFKKLDSRIIPQHESADILREVAFAFEESGDVATALIIMQKALQVRPSGPLIKKKVSEYLKQLKK